VRFVHRCVDVALSPRWSDALVVAVTAALVVATSFGRLSQAHLPDDGVPSYTPPDGPGVALLLLGTALLAFRRSAPVAVLTANAGIFFAYQALGDSPPPVPLALLVALFTVALLRRPLVAATATVVVVAIVVADTFSRLGTLTDDEFFVYVLTIVAALLVGYGIQLSRARASLAEERAAQLGREQDRRTRAAVEEEQSRIARELHDLVAHSVSVIVAQAGAARRVFDDHPEQVRTALGSIEDAGREAMQGMRRLVGLLRIDADQVHWAPPPALAQRPGLVAKIARAGVPVRLTVTGTPRPLPAAVELNAYRIVQEALTNTLKHAGQARARVVIGYHSERLTVRVQDDGRGVRPSAPAGHGLLGMRQRVAMMGGELSTGPGAGRGFCVTATLPVPRSPA
jgi:signal transduction histidine kinase